MANYNDYQLEDAEDAAVRKSKNLKRGIVAGAALAGVGTASAYGATKISEASHDSDSELTSDDLLSGAEVGVDEVQTEETQAHTHHHTVVNETHIHIHNDEQAQVDPELHVEETAVVFDENGEIVASYDAGTYDGKAFIVMDSDGNGKGDIMAYDENNNGVFEDHEVTYLDNQTYEIGKGENLAIYEQDANGDVNLKDVQPNPLLNPMAHVQDKGDDVEGIHNDFLDEKDGEVYGRDLADHNPDYNNHGGQQYTAGMNVSEESQQVDFTDKYDDGVQDYTAHEEAGYDATMNDYHADNEVQDYGYTEPSNDYTAFDNSADSFDEPVYDA